MSRNMIEVNQQLFQLLEDYCVLRSAPIPSAGKTRFVEGTPAEADWLKHAKATTRLSFSRRKAIAAVRYNRVDYVVLVGFDSEPACPGVAEFEMNAGLALCIWTELRPRPDQGPAEVRNVVEVASSEDPDYRGHAWRSIDSLMPTAFVGQLDGVVDDDALWRIFFRLCVDEARLSESWMDDQLCDELLALADLNVPVLPYAALCRSVFDTDPRTLFMALYRCVEATYAYETCRRLADSLALNMTWHELAAELESGLGWRAQESSSLQVVLRYALADDLQELAALLGVEPGDDPLKAASKALYRLRNNLVHFRPVVELFDQEAMDWNRICYRLVGIVFNVFSHAYTTAQP